MLPDEPPGSPSRERWLDSTYYLFLGRHLGVDQLQQQAPYRMQDDPREQAQAADDGQQQIMEEMEFIRDLESTKEIIRRHGVKYFLESLLQEMPEIKVYVGNMNKS